MNTPYSVKREVTKNGKKSIETEWVKNSDKKTDFISKFGEEKFEKAAKLDEKWAKFVTPDLPTRFNWIWLVFLDIWRTCARDFNGNVILTPKVITEYTECFLINLSVYEKHLIFRLKAWAEDTIYELRKES